MKGTGLVVCAGVVFTPVEVVTGVAGNMVEDICDDVVLFPQRECISWLVPENMISSATLPAAGRPAELLKATENCDVFRKRNDTARFCCVGVKLSGSMGMLP